MHRTATCSVIACSRTTLLLRKRRQLSEQSWRFAIIATLMSGDVCSFRRSCSSRKH
jgi:hypothetical protein